jgi:catechol 2,3-dioxygenase-like lactoylglutathione lyase family enzyme
MGDTPFYHVGILVADIDKAIEKFSNMLDLDFAAPLTLPLSWEGEQPYSGDFRVVYSKQGPPHIELFEVAGGGAFVLPSGEGLHHIGVWVPGGHDSYEGRGPGRCLPIACNIGFGDRRFLQWMTKPEELCGVRIEFSDEVTRASTADLIAGRMPGAMPT